MPTNFGVKLSNMKVFGTLMKRDYKFTLDAYLEVKFDDDSNCNCIIL